ncbi:MAG: carbohydrate binding domain-containing protein [Saccharofermentanales bacterium]
MINIIRNPDFKNNLDDWRLQDDPTVTVESADGGKKACLISGRMQKWSSIVQDITAGLQNWGCGEYHLSASAKLKGASNGVLQIAIRAKIDGEDSWFTVGGEMNDSEYKPIDGTATILWKNSISDATIYFIGGGGTNLSDFYCTDINIDKIDNIQGTTYNDYFKNTPKKELYAGRNEKTLIGAIRWDAWLNPDLPTFTAPGLAKTDYIGAQMKRSLSPTEYHFRLPYFGKVISADEVTLPDYSQELFDREQLYANEAGIDYWCYCWYKDGSGMDMARKFHTTSKYRKLVSMCCFISANDMKNPAYMIEQMKQDIWTLVDDGRPLVFLAVNGVTPDIKDVEHFRKSCLDSGLKNPYILGMGTFGITPALVKSLGLEGMSDYAVGAGGAAPFSKLMEVAENKWDFYKATGVDVVPCVMTGWDRRPRIDHPVSWEGPTEDKSGWIETAKPEEIAQHLQNALEWTDKNKENTPFNSLLIYAWNEHDEGGWLCPTIIDDDRDGLPELNEDGTNKPDTRRLEAIKPVIEKWRRS